MVRAITEGYALMGRERIEHTLRLQDELGEFFWRFAPTWIEDRYDAAMSSVPARLAHA